MTATITTGFDQTSVSDSSLSTLVTCCQNCGGEDLQSMLFLGYVPPVNQMRLQRRRPEEQPAFPAEVLYCPRCELVQLGVVVDANVLFPPEYPYTSGTTRILRENFAELHAECRSMWDLGDDPLVVDIGSNDGTLLSNFQNGGCRVRGVEPTDVGNLANDRGVPTLISFFNRRAVNQVLAEDGPATVVTAANVFAHIDAPHTVVDNIKALLAPGGVFVSESHYLPSLLETLQYDTIYHEHLRYYSLRSLQSLLAPHGFEIIHARRIPTHGGSVRVYAAQRGTRTVQPSVAAMLAEEQAAGDMGDQLRAFRERVIQSKLALYSLLHDVRSNGDRVCGVGAPSRASTLISYTGLDDGVLDCVYEVPGSLKIGKCMPGTLIPVVDETGLYRDQPEYALLLSWHIADELIPKLKEKGFRGRFIVPLPTPRVVE